MPSLPDLYAGLGVARTASAQEISQAYRRLAGRFHPDINQNPSAADEFDLISRAHNTLSDSARRAEYDAQLGPERQPALALKATASRASLSHLPEPQTVYYLLEMAPGSDAGPVEPHLNVCLVVDRSTSMQGSRLDHVKLAARQIIESLRPSDVFSVVAFSDRAEVVLPALPNQNRAVAIGKVGTIRAAGGTEILQGLLAGLLEIQRNLSSRAINHLILLTDGRTYGDEDNCLLLATLAEGDGVTINGLGIGDEWNDIFLDRLASSTGGQTHFITSTDSVTRLLTRQVNDMADILAQHLRLHLACDRGVHLNAAFKVAPDAQPMATDAQPLRLGSVRRSEPLAILLELVVATRQGDTQNLARLRLNAETMGQGTRGERHVMDLALPISSAPDTAPPPLAIVGALDKLTLYRLQEKAWAAVEMGDAREATRRLETLASRLLSSGENELAYVAMAEATRIGNSLQMSPEARKRIKYGTRALIGTTKAKR